MQIYSRSRNGTYAPQDKPRQSQQQGLQQPNPKLQPQMSPAQLAYQQQMYQMEQHCIGLSPQALRLRLLQEVFQFQIIQQALQQVQTLEMEQSQIKL